VSKSAQRAKETGTPEPLGGEKVEIFSRKPEIRSRRYLPEDVRFHKFLCSIFITGTRRVPPTETNLSHRRVKYRLRWRVLRRQNPLWISPAATFFDKSPRRLLTLKY